MQTDISRLILVINCGSSSLKFALVQSADGSRPVEGIAERLGSEGAVIKFRTAAGTESETMPMADHRAALEAILLRIESFGRPDAIGHRVVHGAERFTGSVPINAEVMSAIEECVALAPLHNPANLVGIRAAQTLFPDVPQAAVFDTAFHQTLPPKAYHYALPMRLYHEHGIRRYGFHGTSHHFVGMEAGRLLGVPFDTCSLVTAHLGNGCSACAIRDGRSIDTTMGLTPSEGLVMGTRSGDIDPALHQYLQDRTGLRLAEITRMINTESGLLGISGVTNDMRELQAAAADGNQNARLAIEVFCYRLAKAILALCAPLDKLDAIVFTGGIGENSPDVRLRTMRHLSLLGVAADEERNAGHGRNSGGVVTSTSSRVPCLVVQTNEEWMIARETAQVCG